MFRASVTVRTADEASSAIERLRATLDKSDIPDISKSFLIDTSRETLELWQAQLARLNTKLFKAERIFEGKGYRIVLKARSNAGVMGFIKRTLGIR